jgi:hypothetical protein
VFALVGLLTLDFITPVFPLAAVTECLYNTFVMAQKPKENFSMCLCFDDYLWYDESSFGVLIL